jgi:hypothetical protein
LETVQGSASSGGPDSFDLVTAVRAFAVDVACIVVFVALGRGAHEEGSAVVGTLKIAAPFLMALGVGWTVSRLRGWWATPLDRTFAVVLWVVTVALGMILRRTVFDRGTALAFVIVATVFVGAFLVGWRAAVTWMMGRRAVSAR